MVDVDRINRFTRKRTRVRVLEINEPFPFEETKVM